MKTTVVFLLAAFVGLLTPSVSVANAELAPMNWLCKVKAFMEEYEALGTTKIEATFKVTKACKEKHDEMHCRPVECEGENAPSETAASGSYVCKLKAFSDEFEALGSSKTEAKFKVTQACKKKHNEIHCRYVECEGESGSGAPTGNSWLCKVTAFGEKFEALGTSKTEAKFKVTKMCKSKHNEIHCRLDQCVTD